MWDPFKDFDEVFQSLGRLGSNIGHSLHRGPPMDLMETESQFVLSADLPGMKKEDMDLSVNNNKICVKSNRPLPDNIQEKKNQGDTMWMHCAERPFGRFERCFQLPSKINESAVAASYVNGVLEVVLQKEDAKSTPGSRSININ